MSQPDLPLVSVVMPVRNEASFLERSLGAVLDQSYPPDRLEVIVVDGDSDDGTAALARRIGERAAPRVRVIDNPRRSAAAALNLGFDHAQGAIIARVDGHCVIGRDHVATAVRALADRSLGCVGGPIETIGRDRRSRAVAAAMSSRFGVGGSTFRVGGARARDVGTVPFPVMRREVIERVGRYDEGLVRNQDDEYNFRLRHHGLRVRLLPALRASYYGRSTLGGLLRQYFDYGRYKVRVLQLHPRQTSPRHLVPAAFVMAAVAAVLLLPVSPWPALVLFCTYAAALAAASLSTARRACGLLPCLPLAFLALHVGYGAGFLRGLVEFGPAFAGRRTRLAGAMAERP